MTPLLLTLQQWGKPFRIISIQSLLSALQLIANGAGRFTHCIDFFANIEARAPKTHDPALSYTLCKSYKRWKLMEAPSLHDTERSTRLKETSSTKLEKTPLHLTSDLTGVRPADNGS